MLAAVAIPAGTKVLVARFTAAQILGFAGAQSTIVRERGMFGWATDQVAVDETQTGAVGFAIVSEIAAAAGAASVPGPFTDASWDGWYAWYPIVS